MIKTLPIKCDLILNPSAPFNFDGTLQKPSHFPSSDILYEPGCYWQSMQFEGDVYGIRMADSGSIDKPQIKLSIYSDKETPPAQLQRIANEIEYRFDMKANLTEFYLDCQRDELIRPILERWRGMRVSTGTSLYEFLIVTTVLQNATVRRSVQMFENLFNEYGLKIVFDDKELSAFWSPEIIHQTTEEHLRDLKVGYRAKTFKRQAQTFVSGEIDEFSLRSVPNDELKSALLSLYGIGPASVWYLMFEVFKRYDAFDYISPWEQKIYSRILFDQEFVEGKTIIENVNTRWGKWKMLAAHYLFEDLFWQRKNQNIPWLEDLIRL